MASYNIRNQITLFAQSYDYGCWLASTYMLNFAKMYPFGNSFESITRSISLWEDHGVNFNEGMLGPHNGLNTDEDNIALFASKNDLNYYSAATMGISTLAGLLSNGPVMINGTVPMSHFYIISNLNKKDSDADAAITIYDPLPIGQGKIVKTTISDLVARFPNAFYWALQKKI